MATYTLETPRGKRLTIESDSPENAMRLADRWDLEDHAVGEAKRLGVNPDLVLRQMQRESGGNPNAVSPKGARGPMQLMPATARDLGVNPDDPYENITGGVTYYKKQLDSFGGDERKALAAYNAGPGAVQRAGGVPNYPETQAYVAALSPNGAPQAPKRPPPLPGQPGAPPLPSRAAPVARTTDQALGFGEGLMRPLVRIQGAIDKVPGLNLVLGSSPEDRANIARMEADFAEAEKTKKPGGLGKFGGNVVATATMPGGAFVSSGLSGAALSDKTDAEGVLKDALMSAVGGKVASKVLGAAGPMFTSLLGKAPKVMSLPELQVAKKEAYKAVDDAGFVFSKANAQDLVSKVDAFLAKKGWSDVNIPEISRLRNLAKQKGGVMLSQLDDLRSDAYTALVKPGGRDSIVGTHLRQEIDNLIGKEAEQNALIRNARDLNARWAKANAVSKRLESADLARGRAYTGKNTDNTIRQKLSPLVDPMSPQRLRNATPDEAAALKTAVTGSGPQNIVRTAGTMLDPRGVIGMGVQAAAGAKTGGLTIPSALLGMASTAASGRMSQQNVEQLLKLIAVGGSKQALKKTPTAASKAAQKASQKAAPAVVPSILAAMFGG